MLDNYRITVGVTPTLLAENANDDVGLAVLVRNTDATLSIFVGDDDVTVSDGFEVRPGEALGGTLGYSGLIMQSLWAVSSAPVVADVLIRISR